MNAYECALVAVPRLARSYLPYLIRRNQGAHDKRPSIYFQQACPHGLKSWDDRRVSYVVSRAPNVHSPWTTSCAEYNPNSNLS